MNELTSCLIALDPQAKVNVLANAVVFQWKRVVNTRNRANYINTSLFELAAL